MEVQNARFLVSSSQLEQCPAPDRPEYAFIGRSNVGKSSLINMLTNRKGLAKVSSSPGKTTLINHFLINEGSGFRNRGWFLVDLPGYGFAKRSKSLRNQWERMIETYLKDRRNLQTLFVLLDSRLHPQQIDLDFIRRLGEWGMPFNLIFTKADKNKQSETFKNVKTFRQALLKEWESLPEHFVTSAIKGTGRKEVLTFIDRVNDAFVVPEADL